MKATKACVWDLYNGAKQYKVPLFQRPYVWSRQQWEQLWSDIGEQYTLRESSGHSHPARFLGSVVVVREYEKNLDKYVIIDGQQRITTISIILAVIRAFAREKGMSELYGQISGFLKNAPKSGEGQYVVIPTRIDKKALFHIFDEDYVFDQDSRIVECFDYFWWQLDRSSDIDLNILQQVITEDLCVVYIELDEGENPNQVFEALNYRGVPLEESDLIRNFFFAHLESQEVAEIQYDILWKPMEERLMNEQSLISSFLRHYCMKEGRFIRSGEIFEKIHRRFQNASPEVINNLLEDISRASQFYRTILFPVPEEGDSPLRREIKKALFRIGRISNNEAAPFLLLTLAALEKEEDKSGLSEEHILNIISCIESYLIRRKVCARSDVVYEDVFEILCRAANESSGFLTSEETSALLSSLQAPFDMPDDDEFTDHLKYSDLYQPESQNLLAFVILERLEDFFSSQPRGSEPVEAYDLFEGESETWMIDHIMPENLSDWWKNHLGSEWSSVHPDNLHRLGNLTLTQENPAIKNADFETKKSWYGLDNLLLNGTMRNIRFWRRYQIDQRSGVLAAFCVKIWGMCESPIVKPVELYEKPEVCMRQGEIPKKLRPVVLTVAGTEYPVKFWYQVLETTIRVIYEKEPKKFDRIIREYPAYFSDDPSRYKSCVGSYSFKSRFGRYQIRDMCLNFVRIIGWSEELWCLSCE
ncbi:MAG: DUF262 domain-containing protein [Methanomicrobiales archaeon]|nr:DUF262 domain-containing protein [Methanomicrobiales archaeon]